MASGRPQTEEGVYVVKDGKLQFVKVETGLAGELMIEVKKGPDIGAEIVTGPFKMLRQVKEGDKVAIEKESDKKKKEDAKARDGSRALPRLGFRAHAAQAARLPDAARRDHRRRDRRGRRLRDLGAELLRQGQGLRPQPRHRHLHQVRHHHEPRRVAARDEAAEPHALRHGVRAARVPALRAGRRRRRSGDGPSSTATRSSRTWTPSARRPTWARR